MGWRKITEASHNEFAAKVTRGLELSGGDVKEVEENRRSLDREDVRWVSANRFPKLSGNH